MSGRYVGWIVLLLAITVAAGYGWYVRAVEGLKVTAMSPSMTSWGMWVAFYIFFVGLSAGAFLVSSLVYGFGMKQLESVGRYALIIAILSLVGVFLSILPDLGRMDRFYRLYTEPNFTSWMAIEAWMYVVYVIILLAELYLASRYDIINLKNTVKGIKGAIYRALSFGVDKATPEMHARDMRAVRALAIIGIPVAAIGVHGGTGAIFGVVGARPLWYGPYTPIYFVLSAMLSGAAFLLAAYLLTNKLMNRPIIPETVKSLRNIILLLLFLEWFFIFWEIVVSLWPTSPIEHIEVARLLLFGPYWYVFWIVELLIGFIIPAAILLSGKLSKSLGLLTIAGLMIVIGIVGIRFNIVMPTLAEAPLAHLPPEWDIKQMPWSKVPAYPGVIFDWVPNYGAGVPYFPTVWEVLVELSVVSFLVLLYSLAVKIVPVQQEVVGSE